MEKKTRDIPETIINSVVNHCAYGKPEGETKAKHGMVVPALVIFPYVSIIARGFLP